MTPSELDKKLKEINPKLQLDCINGNPTTISYDGCVVASFEDNTLIDNWNDYLTLEDAQKVESLFYEYLDSLTATAPNNPFKQYTDYLADILLEKNNAYGDSFTKSVNDYGLSVIGIRLSDKYNRIHHLITNNEMKENDESLRDTLLDMAGYSILALRYLDEH